MMVIDPYYDNVKLLLHCGWHYGLDTFKDDSPNPKTVTTEGTVTISDAVRMNGGTSALCDSGNLYIPSHADFNLGTGDYCYELNIYRTTDNGLMFLVVLGDVDGTRLKVRIDVDSRLSVYSNGALIFTTTAALSLNTKYHLAFERISGVLTCYINGTADGSGAAAGSIDGYTRIGGDTALAGGRLFGSFNEVRLTAYGRYGGNFTPQDSIFYDESPQIEYFKSHADRKTNAFRPIQHLNLPLHHLGL